MHSECILSAGFKIQDSRFLGTLWSKSWIRIQDSRFKISGDSLGQILNPGFKIQDFWGLFGANLESGFKIQDSRFLRTLSSKSWIQDSRFKIQDFWGLFGANLYIYIYIYVCIYIYMYIYIYILYVYIHGLSDTCLDCVAKKIWGATWLADQPNTSTSSFPRELPSVRLSKTRLQPKQCEIWPHIQRTGMLRPNSHSSSAEWFPEITGITTCWVDGGG